MSKKISMGVIAFLPMLYISYLFSQVLKIYDMVSGGIFFPEFSFPMWIPFLGMVLFLMALVAFIADVFKNNKVKKDLKAVWVIVLLVGNSIAMLLYWYLYIWKDEK